VLFVFFVVAVSKRSAACADSVAVAVAIAFHELALLQCRLQRKTLFVTLIQSSPTQL